MISRVRGTLASVRSDRVEVTTASGVTYELFVPAGVFGSVGKPGDDVELHSALVAREDSLELFGFSSAAERELFLRLQGASGVGPRLALAILGTLPATRVVRAIRNRDHAALQMVSGIGRKTAERIALELTDKMDDLETLELVGEEPDAASSALSALRALGYSAVDSEKALSRARRELAGEETGTEAIVRAALRHL